MKKLYLKQIGFLLAILSFYQGQAQTQSFPITSIDLEDDKVIIHYVLNDENKDHQYLIQLFSSQDNFTTALTKVSGDAGTEVRPGASNKIIWDATKELGAFKGDLSFEVRGRVYVPFVKLKSVNEGDVFKRGKNYPITWTSGNLSGQVNIELYKGEVRISGDNNQPNVGKYDWYVPGSAKKGNNYRLKFTNAKDRNDVVYSKEFTVKPRTPFLIKALGVAVIGGGVAFLAGGKSSSNSSSPTDTPLPAPAFDHP
jgi:hypothetical protein